MIHFDATFEHGQRARYVRGCRCDLCTRANTLYARSRYRAVCRGDSDPLISSARARRYLKRLRRAGVGLRVVADLAQIPRSTLQKIRSGSRRHCRQSSSERICSVTIEPWADGHYVDARPSWRQLDRLLSDGWTKTELARQLGSTALRPALQLRRDRITARNARQVARLFARLRRRLPPTLGSEE